MAATSWLSKDKDTIANKSSNNNAPAKQVQKPVRVIMDCTDFEAPSSISFLKPSKTLLRAPKIVWLHQIALWCLEDYSNAVAFIRRVQHPLLGTEQHVYQPGLISMYDAETLRAWSFKCEHTEPPFSCGADLTYIPLTGAFALTRAAVNCCVYRILRFLQILSNFSFFFLLSLFWPMFLTLSRRRKAFSSY